MNDEDPPATIIGWSATRVRRVRTRAGIGNPWLFSACPPCRRARFGPVPPSLSRQLSSALTAPPDTPEQLGKVARPDSTKHP